MVAKDKEVDEINHQLTKDDGKLVPANQHTTDITWGNLTNIHRTNSRSQAYTNTTNNTIKIEDDKQG